MRKSTEPKKRRVDTLPAIQVTYWYSCDQYEYTHLAMDHKAKTCVFCLTADRASGPLFAIVMYRVYCMGKNVRSTYVRQAA